MQQAEIINIVRDALAKEFELDPEQLTPEADFNKDLGLDSLDAVDMVIVLENAFKIKIRANYDPQQMRTMGDLCAFVQKLVEERDKAAA